MRVRPSTSTWAASSCIICDGGRRFWLGAEVRALSASCAPSFVTTRLQPHRASRGAGMSRGDSLPRHHQRPDSSRRFGSPGAPENGFFVRRFPRQLRPLACVPAPHQGPHSSRAFPTPQPSPKQPLPPSFLHPLCRTSRSRTLNLHVRHVPWASRCWTGCRRRSSGTPASRRSSCDACTRRPFLRWDHGAC